VNPSEQQHVSISARTQFTGREQQPGSSRLVTSNLVAPNTTLRDQDPLVVSPRTSSEHRELFDSMHVSFKENRELFDPVHVSFKDALHESGALACSSQCTYFHHRQHSHQPQRARSLSDNTRVQGCVLRELHSTSRATGIVPATWRSSGHLSNSAPERSTALLRSASAPVLPREHSQACGWFRQGPAAQPVSCSSLIQQMQQRRQQQQQQKQQRLTSGCSKGLSTNAAAATSANALALRPLLQRAATQAAPSSWQVLSATSPTATALSMLPIAAAGPAAQHAPPPFCVPSPARAGARATLTACRCPAAATATAGRGASVTVRQLPPQQLVAGGCCGGTANATAAAAGAAAAAAAQHHVEATAAMALPAGRALWHCRSLESIVVSPKPAQYFRAMREVDVGSSCTTFLGCWQQAVLQHNL